MFKRYTVLPFGRMIGLLCLILSTTFANAEGIKIQNANFDQSQNQLIIKGKIDKLGKNVTVNINDAYTQAFVASTITDKQFRFNLPIGSNDIVPCEIEVTANGVSAFSEVKHAPINCGSYQVTLSGLITDEPIPFATVSVTLDGVTYTTTADETGAYSLDILTKDINQLLKIESQATHSETGNTINFVNLVGTFSRVLEGEEIQNVTNVTTASYVLAVAANGGNEPTTTEELSAAETAVDATELFELAAVIKLIVDYPEFDLPQDFDNILAFVSDQVAVNNFISQAEANFPGSLAAAKAAILNDSNLVAGFKAEQIPESYYVIPTTNPGYLARSGSVLEFYQGTSDGLSLSFGWGGEPINAAFTWQINNGRLETTMTYPSPYLATTYNIEALTDDQAIIDRFYAVGGTQNGNIIDYFATVTHRNYTRITDGTLVDTVSVEVRQTLSIPPFVLADGTTMVLQDKVEINTSEQTLRSSLDIQPIPFTAECSGNSSCLNGTTWGGLMHYAPGAHIWGGEFFNTAFGDLLSFSNDGKVTGAISGVTADWALIDGILSIDYPDGTNQKAQILDHNGVEYGVYSLFTQGQERYASYDIFVKSNGFSFTQEYINSAPGKYWNGEVNSWLKSAFDENGQRSLDSLFGWEFSGSNSLTNHTWFRWDYDSNGSVDIVHQLTQTNGWSILSNGNIKIQRYSNAERFWYPITNTIIDGERMFYVMELEKRDYGSGLQYFIPARLNIEREIDFRQDVDFTHEEGPF
jgi:hypothetical protein